MGWGPVYGPGYAAVPPQGPRAQGGPPHHPPHLPGPPQLDPFTAAERDTRAMVSADWWPAVPQQQRQYAIAGQLLVLPDGTWWLFGAWARWYRLHPADGQWHLCPPPRVPRTRLAATPLRGRAAPELPPHVVPAGPDFAVAVPSPRPFVDQSLPAELTTRVRAIVRAAAELPVAEHPHSWAPFATTVPSTVVVTWATTLWCAAAPVFDSRLDDQLLGVWNPYRDTPLQAIDGPRWMTPPPLVALVGLYAERLRAGQVEAAVTLLRTMWAMAGVLREDARFRARAEGLVAILGPTLNNPTVDYDALAYGDQAVVQQWLTRCPPHLAPALRMESSAGEHFRHSYYELAQAIVAVAGDPAGSAYVEPRLAAAAYLAADLAIIRQDVIERVVPWLDPEIQATVRDVLAQPGHPLRRLWPAVAAGSGSGSTGSGSHTVLPDLPPDAGPRAPSAGDAVDQQRALLAAMYGLDLAWCRLGGGIPARPRGFPVPIGIIARLVGPERAQRKVTGPVRHAGHQDATRQETGSWDTGRPHPGGQEAGAEPDPNATQLDAELPPPPAADQPTAAAPSSASPDTGPSSATAPHAVPAVAAPSEGVAAPEDTAPPDSGPPPREDGLPPSETVVDTVDPEEQAASSGGTQVFPDDLDDLDDGAYLDDTPLPSQPIDEIAPPPAQEAQPVVERFGVAFVCGAPRGSGRSGGDDAGRFLDELAVRAAHAARVAAGSGQQSKPDPAATPASTPTPAQTPAPTPPSTPAPSSDSAGSELTVLLVGAPHTGQRRMARLVARTFADAGVGNGELQPVNVGAAEGISGTVVDPIAPAPTLPVQPALGAPEQVTAPTLLIAQLDEVLRDEPDPAAALAELRGGDQPVVATCSPRAYRRLVRQHPEVVRRCQVFRLPDLGKPDSRMMLLHVLADERQVTISGPAMEAARTDLTRLHGPGELVNARLVEAYLERACERHLAQSGAAQDRLVLTPDDLAGVAEAIEPALRSPGDVDSVLRRLDALVGLDPVKQLARDLMAVAQQAADSGDQTLQPHDASRRLIFIGPPGTGKSTVAELVGDGYAALGLLGSGHVVTCEPVELADRNHVDTEEQVAAAVERAAGGVLLVRQAAQLRAVPAVRDALLRCLAERGPALMVVCTGRPEEMGPFLAADPGFQAEFDTVIEFPPLSSRALVRVFQQQADRDLYLLDEEVKVELLARFERMRGRQDFAYARTARAIFEQTVARQGARLAGTNVNAAAVARLVARDLPESTMERMLGGLRQDPRRHFS